MQHLKLFFSVIWISFSEYCIMKDGLGDSRCVSKQLYYWRMHYYTVNFLLWKQICRMVVRGELGPKAEITDLLEYEITLSLWYNFRSLLNTLLYWSFSKDGMVSFCRLLNNTVWWKRQKIITMVTGEQCTATVKRWSSLWNHLLTTPSIWSDNPAFADQISAPLNPATESLGLMVFRISFFNFSSDLHTGSVFLTIKMLKKY